MNYGKTMKWGSIGLCSLMVAAALAMPANATEGAAPFVDEGNGPARQYIIVNLGVIGDTWGISCELTDGYVEYHVELDRDNTHDAANTADPGNGYDYRLSGDAGDLTPDSDTCIGGAVGPWDVAAAADYAHVELQDYVFGGCEAMDDRCGENLLIPADTTLQTAMNSWTGVDDAVLMGAVTFNPSGLFRIQAEITGPNPTGNTPSCLIEDDDTPGDQIHPDICQRAGDVTATRNYMAMGFCGEGYTGLVTIDDTDSSVKGTPTAGAQLFADSPALGLLDCFFDANPIVNDCTPGPCYAQVAQLINENVTCNHDDSDNVPDTVCLFEDLPAFVACNDLLTTVGDAVPGIPVFQLVGEGGWEATDSLNGCLNAGNTDEDWVEGAGTTIIIDAGSELNPIVDEVQDVADMVDFCAAFSLDGESCRHGPI